MSDSLSATRPVRAFIGAAARVERGAILPMAAVATALLVLLIAVLLVLGYGSLAKSELRTAANGAALNAANVLCSTQTCWNNARTMAMETISRSTIHGRLTDDSSISVSGAPNLSDPPTWNLPNAVVVIERGHWIPPASGDINGTFESLEDGVAWAAAHPGVPRYAVANAVRVVIRRPTLGKILVKSEFEHSMEASAVAVADAVEEAYAAPFAVPVCSLLDTTGSYMKEGSLRGERFFTRADRYCPSGDCGCNSSDPSYPFCARVPGFPIEPKTHRYFSAPGNNTYLCDNRTGSKTIGCSSDSSHLFSTHPSCRTSSPSPLCSYNWDSYIGWHQALFLKRSHHFGFVGLPSGDPSVIHQPTIEGEVVSILNQPGGVRLSRIGDPFVILDNGLSTGAAEDSVWNQISGVAGEDPYGNSAHPAFKEAAGQEVDQYYQSNKAEFEENLWFSYGICDLDYSTTPPQPYPSGFRGGYGCHVPDSFDLSSGAYLGPSNPRSRDRTSGVCNSRRLDSVLSLPPVEGWGALTETSLWEANVPVVANFSSGAPACGTDPYQEDPRVSPRDDWRVIGFLRVNFFDADVGRAPPSDYEAMMRKSFFYRFYGPGGLGGGFYYRPQIPSTYMMDSPFSPVPPFSSPDEEALRSSSRFPYSFPMDCNVVRGKLVIDSDLIPLTPKGLIPVRRGELRYEGVS